MFFGFILKRIQSKGKILSFKLFEVHISLGRNISDLYKAFAENLKSI